ncbi:DUSAM domain-containing protein [Stigmatella hybrida]|uniref:DUSAM domain-containing protein n=1 Tax=Stigmatella hybrida TaxID=394097 RepID=UPI001CDB4034|nr:DUSAM domain-containing protein [Stigmatella hybrida]
MEDVDADLDAVWNQLWELENRVQRGEALNLTPEVRALLQKAAPTVAISRGESEAALASMEGATALLLKIRARIREGSHRLSDALHRMYRLRDSGSLDAARQLIRDLLAVEVVPLYRDIAEGQLEQLDEPS